MINFKHHLAKIAEDPAIPLGSVKAISASFLSRISVSLIAEEWRQGGKKMQKLKECEKHKYEGKE